MSMRRARALAVLALTLLAGLAARALGLARRSPVLYPPAAPPGLPLPPASHLRKPGPTQIWRSAVLGTLVLLLVAGGAIYAAYQAKLTREMRTRAIALTAGDPDLGRDLLQRYGCAGCHTIPGVERASGKVGPSLQGFAARVYVGGVTTNTPDSLIQWIENPRSLSPNTAMPVTGISRTEARHVAAYLYTLR